jgi:hypothetical protein
MLRLEIKPAICFILIRPSWRAVRLRQGSIVVWNLCSRVCARLKAGGTKHEFRNGVGISRKMIGPDSRY